MAKIIPVLSPPGIKIYYHPQDVINEAGITLRDLQGSRVIFINMPLRETAPPVNTPEGPLLMATNLRDKYGVNASVIDLNAYRIKDEEARRRNLANGRHLTHIEALQLINAHIKKYGEPDVVAMSGMITTLKWQEVIAKLVRSILPNVFLVAGNGLATELGLRGGLFQWIPELDAVCRSEGDDVVIKIVYDALLIKLMGIENAINSGKLEPYYLGYVSGRHRFKYEGDRPKDLDALPFGDLELIQEDALGQPVLSWYTQTPIWSRSANNSSAVPWEDVDVTPKTSSVSSRGCPFACKYCYRGNQGETKWGIRSAEHILAELTHHKEKYGIKFHGIPDDNFAVTSQRIARMVELGFGDLGIIWGTHTRLDEVAGLNPNTGKFEDPLRVKLMADAGCKYIGFGPESASARVLEAIGKGGHTLTNGFTNVLVDGRQHAFPTSMVLGIKHAIEHGIHSNCTWIVGSPTETLDDVKESVLFIKWQTEFYEQFGIPASAVNQKMFTMTWYPGVTLINNQKVRETLSRVFKLTFVPAPPKSKVQWEPVMDEHFKTYVEELDDATKVLHDPETGQPLHFSDMTDDEFIRVRECVDENRLFDILDL